MREGVDDNYRAFVEKVASARKRKFEDVEPLAQGRVWMGSQAKERGLIDELGGLAEAAGASGGLALRQGYLAVASGMHDLVVVGGGPAGMMLGYLLARAGVDVVVLEKHGDFLRDFRGDTIHPSTLDLMHELGLLDCLGRSAVYFEAETLEQPRRLALSRGHTAVSG